MSMKYSISYISNTPYLWINSEDQNATLQIGHNSDIISYNNTTRAANVCNIRSI